MILSFEGGSSRSHYVEESFWRRLWTRRQTEYWLNWIYVVFLFIMSPLSFPLELTPFLSLQFPTCILLCTKIFLLFNCLILSQLIILFYTIYWFIYSSLLHKNCSLYLSVSLRFWGRRSTFSSTLQRWHLHLSICLSVSKFPV